ncbi:MAG: HEAT repeat domain-containing protein [Bryobacterales bacterium]|nr:HEAT repeat domain-containing protein [Bryobacterales bacterium]
MAERFRAAVAGDAGAVAELQADGRDEVFRKAMALTVSRVTAERVAGLAVLAEWQLAPECRVWERVLLGKRAVEDPEAAVVRAGARVLGQMSLFSDEAQAALRDLAGHADAAVRLEAAEGLAARMGEGELEVMLELMEDEDARVRNWATFGVGSDAVLDSPAVRAGLRARLEDSQEETRLEAIWGLALRRDGEGLALLAARFEGERWVSGDEEAAEEVLEADELPGAAEVGRRLRRLAAGI